MLVCHLAKLSSDEHGSTSSTKVSICLTEYWSIPKPALVLKYQYSRLIRPHLNSLSHNYQNSGNTEKQTAQPLGLDWASNRTMDLQIRPAAPAKIDALSNRTRATENTNDDWMFCCLWRKQRACLLSREDEPVLAQHGPELVNEVFLKTPPGRDRTMIYTVLVENIKCSTACVLDSKPEANPEAECQQTSCLTCSTHLLLWSPQLDSPLCIWHISWTRWEVKENQDSNRNVLIRSQKVRMPFRLWREELTWAPRRSPAHRGSLPPPGTSEGGGAGAAKWLLVQLIPFSFWVLRYLSRRRGQPSLRFSYDTTIN